MGLIKFSVITLIFIAAVTSFGVIVLSIMQAVNHTSSKFPHPLVNGQSVSSICKQAEWEAHLPIRFIFESDTSYVQCAWAAENQLIHFILNVLIIASSAFAIFAILNKIKFFLWLFFLLSFLYVIATFIQMVVDADSIRVSNSWCKSALPAQLVAPMTCSYSPFIITACISAVQVVLWILITYFIFKFNRRQDGPDYKALLDEDQHHHHHHDDHH